MTTTAKFSYFLFELNSVTAFLGVVLGVVLGVAVVVD